MLALFFALIFSARGQNTITNVISPVVSYQYYDSLTDDKSSPIVSLPVSYQFYDSLTDMGANSPIISPIASYQYFDSLGSTGVQFLNSPFVSYFYNIGAIGPSVAIYGQVSDLSGASLPGATITASILQINQATTLAAPDGTYSLPPLPPGVYVVKASLAGYASSTRALTLSGATSQENFMLAPLPAPPMVVQTTRQPPAAFMQPPGGPLGSTLKIFNGTAFVPIDANNKPDQNVMTIVLTHGWTQDPFCDTNPGIEGWPAMMAAELRANKVTAGVANILGWDWYQAAYGCRFPPQENTPEQGVELGQKLQQYLGVGYTQPLHFIGHSLGTMVNAAAVNFLHGGSGESFQQGSTTPWSIPIHVTLFDNAEVSGEFSGNVQTYFDGTTVNTTPTGILLPPNALQAWAPAMPSYCTWADSYVSLVGIYQPKAVNVVLERGVTEVGINPINAHGYPMTWYEMSINKPTDPYNPLGFRQSYEFDIILGDDALDALPPSEDGLQGGATYYQELLVSDQLALVPGGNALPALYGQAIEWGANGVNAVAEGYMGTIQAVGKAEADVEDTAQQAVQLTMNGVNLVETAAEEGGQNVANIFDTAVLKLTLHTGPPTPSQQSLGLAHPDIPQPADATATNTPAMAWLPVQIPATALAMAFDFMVAGNPAQDSLVCGIGESNLFSLQAQYVPTNTVSASRLIDVSAWAGQNVELFFGFMGGTSTNATLEIDNIRFFNLQPPSLTISQTNGVLALSWPNTANGYVLESTANLTTPVWSQFTNPPSLLGGSFIVTDSWPDQARFFRLRSQ